MFATYWAISACCADHDSVWAWNIAAIFSSSVMALFICSRALEVALVDAAVRFVCSLREEFLAVTGILPETYLAARPAPGLLAGSRRATTVVDR